MDRPTTCFNEQKVWLAALNDDNHVTLMRSTLNEHDICVLNAWLQQVKTYLQRPTTPLEFPCRCCLPVSPRTVLAVRDDGVSGLIELRVRPGDDVDPDRRPNNTVRLWRTDIDALAARFGTEGK